MFGQEQQGAFAADAADRDDKGDAGARHVDLHLVAQSLLDAGPCVGGDDGEQDGFFGAFQPQRGQHILHGGARAHGAQADIYALLLVELEEGVCGAAVGDGDQPVKRVHKRPPLQLNDGVIR